MGRGGADAGGSRDRTAAKIIRETSVKREASAVTCAVTIGKCPGNRRMGNK